VLSGRSIQRRVLLETLMWPVVVEVALVGVSSTARPLSQGDLSVIGQRRLDAV
jgi:hypothetical protein